MNLRALKWLAIVLPVLFLGAVDVLRQVLFGQDVYGLSSRIFFFALLAAAVALFSQAVFAVIDRLQARVLSQNEQLAALNQIATASAERPQLESLLDTALAQVLGVLRADAGMICTIDRERDEHSAVASRGFSNELVQSLQRAKLCEDPILLEVVETGQPVVLERLLDDPTLVAAAEREGIRSAINVPLKAHGEVTGAFALATRTERRFGKREREFLANVGGQLGMAIKHASAFEQSQQRNREMEALLTISGAVTSSLDLPDVLDRALETILEVSSAEAAEIWLADDGDLTLARHSGASPEAFHESTRVRIGEGLPGVAVETRAPVVVHDLGQDSRFLRSGVREAGFQTYCALPLLHRHVPLGVLGVAARTGEACARPEELRLLAGIGEVISVAIENARLYERVQDTAVLEERERIAREMHDGLAQVLTYINAQSLAIGKLLSSGRVPDAQDELAKMEEAVQAVYADVREAILGLRTSPRSEEGLLASLRSYLEAYEEMTGLDARLTVGLDVESATLPAFAEIQLTRIVQEALSNVRKHAEAGTATVGIELGGQTLRVRIEDDGQGFDPEGLHPRGWPRFGLQTMRERAEAIGGRLQITSHPGRGTRVEIELDVEEQVQALPSRDVVEAVVGSG